MYIIIFILIYYYYYYYDWKKKKEKHNIVQCRFFALSTNPRSYNSATHPQHPVASISEKEKTDKYTKSVMVKQYGTQKIVY